MADSIYTDPKRVEQTAVEQVPWAIDFSNRLQSTETLQTGQTLVAQVRDLDTNLLITNPFAENPSLSGKVVLCNVDGTKLASGRVVRLEILAIVALAATPGTATNKKLASWTEIYCRK
jgi:hypothetical protein